MTAAATLPVDQQTDDDLVASMTAAAESGDTATQAAITAEIETRTVALSSEAPAEVAEDKDEDVEASLGTIQTDSPASHVATTSDSPAPVVEANVGLSQATDAAPAAVMVDRNRPAPAIEQGPAAPAPVARKGMNIAVILSRLGYEDLSSVNAENAEEMILSGIDALEQRVTAEADAALSLSRQEMDTALIAARSGANGRRVSDIEVKLKGENLELRLGNLIEAGRLTPAAANELKGLFDPGKLSLSLSRGDDTLDKVLEIIAHNEPPVLTELTGAQSRGAVRLSRKTGKSEPLPTDDGGEAGGANPELLADADRRRKEWEAQKAAASACR